MKKRWMLLAATIISSSLWAQQDSTAVSSLDEVVVTASKMAQKQSTTGKVISVISKAQIEQAGSKSVAQLLNEQAGITVNGALNNAGANQTIYMRGAGAGRTLILLDGIPVYDPSLINNEFDLNLIALNDVERVEICRGAQSTLYGSDAIAGVINIITTQQDIEKPLQVKALISGGNYGTGKGNLQVYGKTGKLSYTARYGKIITHGFSSAHDSTGQKDFEKDAYNGNIASAHLRYAFSEAFSVKTFIHFSNYKSDIDAGTFTDESDFTINNRNLMAGTGLQYRTKNVLLVMNYQYSNTQRNYLNDSLQIAGFTKFATNDYAGQSQFLEAYANIQLGKGFSILQGADYRYSSMNNQYFSISSFGPYTNDFSDTSHSQASLYASLFFKGWKDKWNIEWGGRMNVHSRYGNNSTFTFNPSYQINKSWRVFGSIASGYKAPSLYQLYDGFSGNALLEAETSKNYEAGVQYNRKNWNARAVYFNRKTDNGIDYNYISFQYFNYVKQKASGLELEANFQPGKKINIAANYTLLTGLETTQNRLTNKDTVSYDYLLRRPKHSINLNAGIQFTPSLYGNISIKYVSSRYDVGGYQEKDIKLKNYTLFNAYVSYQLNTHFSIFADAQNIGSQQFFDIYGYQSIPFLWNTGLRLNW